MNRSPAQERMLSIITLQNDMFKHLYDAQQAKMLKDLEKIAVTNTRLLGAETNSFAFNGVMYNFTPDAPKNSINKQLHHSLYQQVTDIIRADDFDEVAVKAHINHTFSIILSAAQHIDDLRALLHTAFAGLINKVDPEFFNIGLPLSADRIAELKELTADSTAIINELCITRLLLTT